MSAATSILAESESRIPIIDVGTFLRGSPQAAEALAHEVVRTCLDTGFLVITNHGVPQTVIDQAFGAAECGRLGDTPGDDLCGQVVTHR